jgi:hypothetical protein
LRDITDLSQILHLDWQGPGRSVVNRFEAGWDNTGGVVGDATAGDVSEGVQISFYTFDKCDAIE